MSKKPTAKQLAARAKFAAAAKAGKFRKKKAVKTRSFKKKAVKQSVRKKTSAGNGYYYKVKATHISSKESFELPFTTSKEARDYATGMRKFKLYTNIKVVRVRRTEPLSPNGYKIRYSHPRWGNNGEERCSTPEEAKWRELTLKAQGATKIRIIRL